MRKHLSYANVAVTLCLFVVLGGVSYAAVELTNDSVQSRHIVNGEVKSADLADDKVKGQDVRESSLDMVPNADQLDGQDSSHFAQAGSEAWNAATFGNGTECTWFNVGSGNNPAAFLRDPAGFVHLRGLVSADKFVANDADACEMFAGGFSDEVIFTLPAGYRPSHAENHATIGEGELAHVQVLPDGTVRLAAPEGSVATFDRLSLDGITFRCAPSGENGCP